MQVKCNDLPQTANNFMPARGKRVKKVNVLFNRDAECISPENGGHGEAVILIHLIAVVWSWLHEK